MYVFFFWISQSLLSFLLCFFFFNDTATTEIYTLSLHDALPISLQRDEAKGPGAHWYHHASKRSEEHTSELQSRRDLVCRLLLEKKKNKHSDLPLKQKKKINQIRRLDTHSN